MSNITIKGGKELALALRELPLRIEKKIMRRALTAGAKIYRDEAKENAPKGDYSTNPRKEYGSDKLKRSGDLVKSIRIKSDTKKGVVEAKVVAGGTKKVFYAHMVEFGTAPHVIKARNGGVLKFTSGGKQIKTPQVNHTGATAKPFMRPAMDTQSDKATQVVADNVRTLLQQEKLNKG